MNTLGNPTLYRRSGIYRILHYFFLFWVKYIDLWYSLEPPHRGGSNKHRKPMYGAKIRKILLIINRNIPFLEPWQQEFILHRYVILMNAICKHGIRWRARLAPIQLIIYFTKNTFFFFFFFKIAETRLYPLLHDWSIICEFLVSKGDNSSV